MSTKKKVPVFSVGVFLLVGLSLLGWMVIKYGATNKVQKGYDVEISFSDASGIIKGGLVRLAGANVGYVSEVPILNQQEIVSLSLLGDKAIYIRIPDEPSQSLLKAGSRVQGVSPEGLGEVQTKAEELLVKTDETFGKLNNTLSEYSEVAQNLNTSITRLNSTLLADEKLEEISETLGNIRSASQSFEELAKGLHPLADDARLTMKEFRKTAKSTSSTVTGATETIKQAQTTLAKIDQKIELVDPALKTLPETIQTYNKVGKTLETALKNEDSLLSAVTQDKEVKEDTKTFVKNLRTNGILGYKDDSDPDKEDPRDRYRGMRR